MEVKILGSSSAGNCYILSDGSEGIIIECGISLKKAKETLNFDLSKIQGVLISHKHLDHAKYARDYEIVFDTYTNSDVINRLNLTRTTEIKGGDTLNIGSFKVMCFNGHHDVPVLFFIISHKSIGNLMFLTDSFMCDYIFKGLSHIMIECNYNVDALEDAIDRGATNTYMQKRLRTTHMELQTTKKTLLAQDLSTVQTVTLLHLSSENSDEKVMLEEISGATGKRVFVARKGLTVNLSKEPY